MVFFHLQAHFFHYFQHFAADVLAGINRWYREVPAFDARSMAKVAIFELTIAGVRAFCGINLKIALVHVGGKTHVIENEEFSFRAEICRVADAKAAHMADGCLRR